MKKKLLIVSFSVVLSVTLASVHAFYSPTQESQGIRYVTGKMDKQEASRLQYSSQGFNLKLEFLGESNRILEKVRIKVKNNLNNIIFQVDTNDPMMMMRLRPGLYQIEAEHKTKTFITGIAVKGHRLRYIMFRWNQQNTQGSEKLALLKRGMDSSEKQKTGRLNIPLAVPEELLTDSNDRRGGKFQKEALRTQDANETQPVIRKISDDLQTEELQT